MQQQQVHNRCNLVLYQKHLKDLLLKARIPIICKHLSKFLIGHYFHGNNIEQSVHIYILHILHIYYILHILHVSLLWEIGFYGKNCES